MTLLFALACHTSPPVTDAVSTSTVDDSTPTHPTVDDTPTEPNDTDTAGSIGLGEPLPGWGAGPGMPGLTVHSWTWHNPLPQGLDLADVWADDSGTWFVGDGGTVLEIGGTWDTATQLRPGSDADLHGIHGSANDDMWVVGADGTALHFDGWGWSSSALPTTASLMDVFVAERNSTTWAVTDAGEVLHTDGLGWSTVHDGGGSLHGVWGTGDHVWAVGTSVVTFDGTVWEEARPLDGATWYDVSGTGPDDVWIVGACEDEFSFLPSLCTLHWDGLAWHDASPPSITAYGEESTSIWAADDGKVYLSSEATALVFDDHSWRVAPQAPASLAGIHGGAGDTVLWAGAQGFMGRWDGHGLVEISSGHRDTLNAIVGEDDGGVVAVGGDHTRVHRSDGTSWWTEPTPIAEPHWDGLSKGLTGAWAADGEIWVVGHGVVLRHDGGSWSEELDSGSHWGVWGDGGDRVWVAGLDSLRSWDGMTWSDEPDFTGVYVRDVAGAEENWAWAVGDFGFIAHWNGVSWEPQDVPTGAYLHRVAAAAPHAAWSVGNDTVLSWNGVTWELATLPADVTGTSWRGVAAVDADDAWVVGESEVLHWDGAGWLQVDAPQGLDLSSVHAQPDAGVWVAGKGGQILHRP